MRRGGLCGFPGCAAGLGDGRLPRGRRRGRGRAAGGLSAALGVTAALLNRIKKGRRGSRAGCLAGARCYAPLGSEGVTKGVEGEALVAAGDIGAVVEENSNPF